MDDSNMEYLSDAHRESCHSYVDYIKGQIEQLKLKGSLTSTSCIIDNDFEIKIAKLKELKMSNMFTAKSLCEKLLHDPSLTEVNIHVINYELADVLFCVGLFPDAIKILESLLDRKDLILDIKFNLYLLLGHVHRLTGKIKEASQYYHTASLIYPQDSSNINYWCLTVIYQQLCVYATNDNDKALQELKSLLVYKEQLSVETKGVLYQSLANIYRSIADYHSAREHFKEAIRLGKEEGDNYKVMERKGELGRVYRSSGCHTKALKRQELFFRFSLSHGYIHSISASCGYIGFTYYSMGKEHYDKALKYLYARLRLCKEILDDQAGYRWSLNNIGKVYLGLKEHELCMRLFQESGDIAKQHGSILGVGTAYGNMGSTCRAVGKHDEAIMYHKRYLEIAEGTLDTGGIIIMQNELILDHLFLYENEKEQAKKESILDIVLRHGVKATRTCVQVRQRLSKQDDLLKIGNFEMNQAKTYSLLQYILILKGLHDVALLIAEYSRARALADAVSQKITKPIDCLTDILNISDCDGNLIQSQIALEIKSIGILINNLKSHLLIYSIINDPLTKDTLLYTWHVQATFEPSVRTKINFYSSLFNYSNNQSNIPFDDDYFGCLMREIGTTGKYFIKDQSTSRDIVPRKSQRQNINQHEEKKPKEEKKERLKELYSILIEPLLSNIDRKVSNRIIIIPQGCLFSIPYPALKNPKNDRYLIQDFVLSLSPSIYFLYLGDKQESAPLRDLDVLAVGNPQMPLDVIEQLPGAEKEVVNILSIMKGQLFCGSEATKEKVVKSLPQHSIIHLATHAILEDSLADHIAAANNDTQAIGDYSVKGAIILAKSNESCSGVLTSSEILNIDLINCQLFVLSCCNTARGKVTTGDGILGLSRSLMCAGATNIVVTLWPIQDASTGFFMSNFYKEYKLTHDGPASLRYSMLLLIEHKYKVEHWAPFCYLGHL